jgi:hypothetical protein
VKRPRQLTRHRLLVSALLLVPAAGMTASSLVRARPAARPGEGAPADQPAHFATPEVSGVDRVLAMLKGIPQNGVTLGDPSAPVELVEFADLQCQLGPPITLNSRVGRRRGWCRSMLGCVRRFQLRARVASAMLPFPPTSLRFRKAGFPRYGSKASFQTVPSSASFRLSLHPAFSSPRSVCMRPSCSPSQTPLTPLCVGTVDGWSTAVRATNSRPTPPGALAPVRVIVSQSIDA